MKTKLTIQQSQRLIELGVSAEKAGDTVTTYDKPNHKVYRPIFTLTDLLQILPKRIKKNNACLTLLVDYNDWSVGYEYEEIIGGINTVKSFSALELIDALYELTIFCIENEFIKI